MGWGDPVVGGTTLVRAAINSPNYVLNVTGWAIRVDGTAQLTGVVLIGGSFTGTNFILNTSGEFFYSGTPANGNLILSNAPAAGTDQFGNAYKAGLVTYANDGFGTFIQHIGGLLVFGNTTFPDEAHGAGAINLQPGGTLLITDGSTGGHLKLNPDGNVQAGPGYLVAENSLGAEETWHNFALVNGWANIGGAARYRLLPDNRVAVSVNISSAGATAFKFSSVAAPYIPARDVFIAAGATANVASGEAPFLEVDTAGNVTMNGLHAFSTAGGWVCMGSYELD